MFWRDSFFPRAAVLLLFPLFVLSLSEGSQKWSSSANPKPGRERERDVFLLSAACFVFFFSLCSFLHGSPVEDLSVSRAREDERRRRRRRKKKEEEEECAFSLRLLLLLPLFVLSLTSPVSAQVFALFLALGLSRRRKIRRSGPRESLCPRSSFSFFSLRLSPSVESFLLAFSFSSSSSPCLRHGESAGSLYVHLTRRRRLLFSVCLSVSFARLLPLFLSFARSPLFLNLSAWDTCRYDASEVDSWHALLLVEREGKSRAQTQAENKKNKKKRKLLTNRRWSVSQHALIVLLFLLFFSSFFFSSSLSLLLLGGSQGPSDRDAQPVVQGRNRARE